MANFKDDFIFDDDILEAEIQALERENLNFEETFCVCDGIETDKMILCEKQSCKVGWYHYDCVGLTESTIPKGKWICGKCQEKNASAISKVDKKRRTCTDGNPATHHVKVSDGNISQQLEKDPLQILSDSLTAMSSLPITKIHLTLATDIQNMQHTINLNSTRNDEDFVRNIKEIVGLVWKIILASDDSKSMSSKFESMCTAFHKLSLSSELSNKLVTTLEQTNTRISSQPFFAQYLLTEIYNCLIKKCAECFHSPLDINTVKPDQKLGEKEEQVLRYVAGFICFKLQKFFKRSSSVTGTTCANLVSTWHSVPADGSKTFLSFTRKWTDKVNLGGLFQVTDELYLLMRRMELVVKPYLDKPVVEHVKQSEHIDSFLSEKVLGNNLVQLSLSHLMETVESDNLKSMITNKLVNAYLSVRLTGFVKSYMFIRKQENKQLSRKGEKGLRREISKENSH